MMDDKELLELAAKAADVEIEWEHDKYPRVKGQKRYWEPITDDGDALRLAVKLGFHIETDDSGDSDTAGVYYRNDRIPIIESHREDACAAVRRAIVRAAAELGKSVVTPN